jgi:hypothetical protein
MVIVLAFEDKLRILAKFYKIIYKLINRFPQKPYIRGPI